MQIFSAIFRYHDQKSPDRLGLYPGRCHIKAFPERRYLWTSRLLVIWAAINISITVMLTMTIYLLLPSRGVQPLLYELRNGALSKVQPFTVKTNQGKLLTESLISEYVKMRHTLPTSRVTLQYQWDENSLFRTYCSNEVYAQFKAQFNKDKLIKYLRQKIKHSVVIDEVINVFGNLYMVRFRTITTMPNSDQPSISLWNAYLRINYAKWSKNNPPQEYLLNPYGFKVSYYEYGYVGKDKANKL